MSRYVNVTSVDLGKNQVPTHVTIEIDAQTLWDIAHRLGELPGGDLTDGEAYFWSTVAELGARFHDEGHEGLREAGR